MFKENNNEQLTTSIYELYRSLGESFCKRLGFNNSDSNKILDQKYSLFYLLNSLIILKKCCKYKADDEIILLNNISDSHKKIHGYNDIAFEINKKALQIANANEIKNECSAYIWISKSRFEKHKKNFEQAEKYLKTAESILKEISTKNYSRLELGYSSPVVISLYNNFIDLYNLWNKRDMALHFQKKLVNHSESFYSTWINQSEILNLLA